MVKWASDLSIDSTKVSSRSGVTLPTAQKGGHSNGKTSASPFAMGTAAFAAYACGVEQRPFR